MSKQKWNENQEKIAKEILYRAKEIGFDNYNEQKAKFNEKQRAFIIDFVKGLSAENEKGVVEYLISKEAQNPADKSIFIAKSLCNQAVADTILAKTKEGRNKKVIEYFASIHDTNKKYIKDLISFSKTAENYQPFATSDVEKDTKETVDACIKLEKILENEKEM